MSLLGSIFKGVAGAVIPSLGSALGASSSNRAIGRAAAAQQAAITAAQGELRNTYDQARSNFASYTEGGQSANEQIRRVLGLGDHNTGIDIGNGPGLTAEQQQAGALSGLRSSPLFQSIFNTGQESVLQNASATGGVRGGNVQNALAENGENAFASVLQNYLAQLSGQAGQGLNATGGLADLGASNARSLAGLFGDSGRVTASNILGQAQIDGQLQQDITGQLTNALAGLGGFGGLGSIFGGGGGAAASGGINNIAKALQNQSGGSVFTRGF